MDNGANEKINIFSQNQTSNPFSASGSQSAAQNSQWSTINPSQPKRLNGYDSTILNKTVYDESEQELSTDYRIREKEIALKNLETKIKQADDFGNQSEALGLKAKRQRVAQELAELRRNQATINIPKSGLKSKFPTVHKVTDFVSRNILAKVSKKVNSIVALNDSLEQLSDISRNVDELIDMNIPYGEKVQNYEKLTEYLNRANKIHSSISKSLGRKV